MEGNTKSRKITFTDEHGKEWTLVQFAQHHGLAPTSIRNRYYRMGRPASIETRELLDRSAQGGQNAHVVTLMFRDGTRRTFGSAKEMSEFAASWGKEHGLGKFLPDTLYKRWRTVLACPFIFNIKKLFSRPKKIRQRTIVSRDVSKGDLAKLSNKMTKDKDTRLRIIPGPSRYERANMNDAGRFGAGEVQRSNFAGRTKGGGPIYTGR